MIPPGTDPMHALLDLGPAFLVAMVGVMLLIFAALGRPLATHPTCRSCRADLRPVAGVPEATCPGCGRRRDRRGVRWRPYPWRWRFLAVGLALVTAGIAFGAWTRAQTRLGLRLSDAFIDDVALAKELAAPITGRNAVPFDRFRFMDRLVHAGRVSPEAVDILEQALLPVLDAAPSYAMRLPTYSALEWLLSTGLGSTDLLVPSLYGKRSFATLVVVASDDGVPRRRLYLPEPAWTGFLPLESVHSVTLIEINGQPFPVRVLASGIQGLAIDLPPEAEAACTAGDGRTRIRWIEHFGHFPATIAQAIVNDDVADPALWPSSGYRTDLHAELEASP